MKKILYIGKDNENMNIFCKAEYTDGTLSISGVIDPRYNGNAGGSCGQINDTIGDDIDNIQFATGWNKELLQKFLYIWDEYH